eukprot:m.11347 g.11347  ORF g.11347 m.11347 type:complete len:784 (+) comp4426_c0_seq1:41-2392(+)
MADVLDAMVGTILRVCGVLLAIYMAYNIRLYAINTYGLVIHEFDPWFNYRATEYLSNHGWTAFFHWFDHESWYPLGRPVGTTIYPGMQITAVILHRGLNQMGIDISLNDVCCYMPCWFGACATCFLGLLAYECSGSKNVGVMSALVMSILPAHIMRSVGGGYDNESVAMTCMMMTFFFWNRSLRGAQDNKTSVTFSSFFFGILAGLAYIYMAAAWGGYVFVLNMIGAHTALLVALGRFTPSLHMAYTLFYAIGTAGAMTVPVIGMTPLKSLEQLPCFGIFGALHLLEFVRRITIGKDLSPNQLNMLRVKVFAVAGCFAAAFIAILAPTGYFGPISSRIRSLFVPHTRTGNPLVDSVAEHQPASPQAYWQYLYYMCFVAPIGFVITLIKRTDASLFLTAYAVVAYYFSLKMARLIILIGPVAASLGGIALAYGIEWALTQLLLPESEDEEEPAAEESSPKKGKAKKMGNKKKGKGAESKNPIHALKDLYFSPLGVLARKGVAGAILVIVALAAMPFYNYCQHLGEAMSNPSIMYKGTMQNGEVVMVDDYREAYWWLKDNTPQDSRVMAWWDYGYQIAGIANRTTIADGNTWNHEHIATLGRCLVSPEKKAHKMVRHLADYVLLWAGGGGDDLAKSPHMARIGNSVYNDICPGDPTCRAFGFKGSHMEPTDMMEKSMLYRLHNHNVGPTKMDPTLWEDVFRSKFGKVRIFRVKGIDPESKAWVADPTNRICDAPGSWYCTGQYPPKLRKYLKKKKAFQQLEDFNVQKDEEARKYNEEYMKRMGGR